MGALHLLPVEVTTSPVGATRHLCAGVYLNEGYRELVVREVCTAPSRRVAPSYGFDLVPVMRHAWCATHLSALLRVVVIAAVLVPLALGHGVATVLTTVGLVLVWMVPGVTDLLMVVAKHDENQKAARSKRPSVRQLAAPMRDRERQDAKAELKRRGGYAALMAGLSILLVITSPAQGLLALYLAMTIVLTALLVGAVRQIRLNRIRVAQKLRPRKLTKREATVARQQEHDCVVFPRPDHLADDEDGEEILNFTLFGDESPFVGAGELIHQWNPPMNIQLLREGSEKLPLHQREYAEPPFQTHELVDHLRDAVLELRDDQAEIRLPALVRDRVYIAESDVSIDRALLGEGRVEPARMRGIINGQDPREHHFLEVSVPTIGGELVATVLLQVRVQGRTLSLSFAACALTRTPRTFQRVHEFGWHGYGAVVWSALAELSGLPQRIATFWKVAPYTYYLAKALVGGHERTLRPRRNVHIGTRVSIREEQAQEWGKVQLDKTDILRQVKCIEQRLLASCSGFLQAHGVSVAEFEKHASQIINNSFNLGNNNNFSNSAVGNGALANNINAEQQDQPVAGNGEAS